MSGIPDEYDAWGLQLEMRDAGRGRVQKDRGDKGRHIRQTVRHSSAAATHVHYQDVLTNSGDQQVLICRSMACWPAPEWLEALPIILPLQNLHHPPEPPLLRPQLSC
jgi:hypothetical protein